MADEEDVEDEDVADEDGVLPTCANISASSCLEHDTCAKILFFFLNQIFSNQRIQVMWIYTCFVLPR